MIREKMAWIYRWLAVCLLVLAGSQRVLAEGEITFREVSLHPAEKSGELVANLQLDYRLTPYLREGLLNGMALDSEIRFSIEWHNSWWWNSSKPLEIIKSQLTYHALSQHYQLVRLDTNENWNFPTLASALEKMGTLTDHVLPALPPSAYSNDASVFVTARLQAKMLELPLQLGKLFTNHYSLESEGVLWPIP